MIYWIALKPNASTIIKNEPNTPAAKSSHITPAPPGIFSSFFIPNGLNISSIRNKKNPNTKKYQSKGINKTVIHCPAHSSMTQYDGSGFCLETTFCHDKKPIKIKNIVIIVSSNGFVVTKTLITTNKHKDMRDAKLPGAINGQYPVPNPEAINLERVTVMSNPFSSPIQ